MAKSKPDSPVMSIENGVLRVVFKNDDIGLPWNEVKRVIDPQFRRRMEKQASKQNRYIALKIRTFRRQKNMSQKELAAKLNSVPSVISKIETGCHTIEMGQLIMILFALGKELKDLAE